MSQSEYSDDDELTSDIEPPFLPTIPFSSDDLRSLHAYSLPRPLRFRGEQGNNFRPEYTHGSNAPVCKRQNSKFCSETSSSSSKPKYMKECISRLRALAGRIQRFAKCCSKQWHRWRLLFCLTKSMMSVVLAQVWWANVAQLMNSQCINSQTTFEHPTDPIFLFVCRLNDLPRIELDIFALFSFPCLSVSNYCFT